MTYSDITGGMDYGREKDYEDLLILNQELNHNEHRFCDAKH